jgi:hypothetical protein
VSLFIKGFNGKNNIVLVPIEQKTQPQHTRRRRRYAKGDRKIGSWLYYFGGFEGEKELNGKWCFARSSTNLKELKTMKTYGYEKIGRN